MYISVPKDFLNDIEPKMIFNLTKRQLICFTLGAGLGLPTYFVLKDINSTLAILGMMFVAIPFFIGGIFKKNQHNLETVISQIYNVKFGGKPKYRHYKTDNYYIQLQKQYELDRAIMKIMNKNKLNKENKNKVNQNKGSKNKGSKNKGSKNKGSKNKGSKNTKQMQKQRGTPNANKNKKSTQKGKKQAR